MKEQEFAGSNDTEFLSAKADEIRKSVMEVALRNKAGHIAPSLSCVDLLVALYYNEMRLNSDPRWSERDRLILSKAHGCYGLYSILADMGYISHSDWDNFYKGSFLRGCVERSLDHGIEASCGSLGHGLPIATGVAFGVELKNEDYRVFCVMGDGELQEGSNWEAVQFAVKHELKNLVVIVDNNGLQAMDFLENILTRKDESDDLKNKFQAFGCETFSCDGHDMTSILGAFDLIRTSNSNIPKVLIAKTIKGYGVKAMENVPKFHFRLPTSEELAQGVRYE